MLRHHIIVLLQLLHQIFQMGIYFDFWYDSPIMNDPYVELSEQLDSLFNDFLHKIKFHIFKDIS